MSTSDTSTPESGSELLPIIVVHSGRVGSTLMMELLGSSLEVAFDRRYAFENAYLAYFWQWARVVDLGSREAPGWNRVVMDHVGQMGHNGLVGSPPFSTRDLLINPEGPPFWESALRAIWREFSIHGRKRHRDLHGGAQANFYAEKGHRPVSEEIASVMDCRLIYLVRDPRDQLRSVFAFNEKRGRRSFGVQADDTIESFAPRFVEAQREQLDTIVGIDPTDPNRRVVRYEDMVEDVGSVGAHLAAWIGLELDPSKLEQRAPHVDDHVTSITPSQSVGRWKSEIPSAVSEMMTEELGVQLSSLGYLA